MKNLGFTKRILGMDMQKDQTIGVLCLSLQGYLKKVVERFRMHEPKPVSTPFPKILITQASSFEEERREM